MRNSVKQKFKNAFSFMLLVALVYYFVYVITYPLAKFKIIRIIAMICLIIYAFVNTDFSFMTDPISFFTIDKKVEVARQYANLTSFVPVVIIVFFLDLFNIKLSNRLVKFINIFGWINLLLAFIAFGLMGPPFNPLFTFIFTWMGIIGFLIMPIVFIDFSYTQIPDPKLKKNKYATRISSSRIQEVPSNISKVVEIIKEKITNSDTSSQPMDIGLYRITYYNTIVCFIFITALLSEL